MKRNEESWGVDRADIKEEAEEEKRVLIVCIFSTEMTKAWWQTLQMIRQMAGREG